MLETYHRSWESLHQPTATRPNAFIASPTPRSSSAVMPGESSSNVLFCPLPLRTSSPHEFRRSNKKNRIYTEERERDACLEIQQILRARPVLTLSTDGEIAIPRPSINRALYFSTPSIPERENSTPGGTGLKPSLSSSQLVGTNENDTNMDMHEDETGSHAEYDQPFSGHVSLRESSDSILNCSTKAMMSSAGLLLVQPQSPVSIYNERGLAVTPPLRSSNPIARNSPFDMNIECEGAEIGLLSFSPPPEPFDI